MARDFGREPMEGDLLETQGGERRTVRAVTLEGREMFVHFHCSRHLEHEEHALPLSSWERWVREHEAKLLPTVED